MLNKKLNDLKSSFPRNWENDEFYHEQYEKAKNRGSRRIASDYRGNLEFGEQKWNKKTGKPYSENTNCIHHSQHSRIAQLEVLAVWEDRSFFVIDLPNKTLKVGKTIHAKIYSFNYMSHRKSSLKRKDLTLRTDCL